MTGSNQHSELLASWAFDHPDHLCNGLCPDEPGKGSPGPESRDPACFYCNVLSLFEQLEALQRERDWWRERYMLDVKPDVGEVARLDYEAAEFADSNPASRPS